MAQKWRNAAYRLQPGQQPWNFEPPLPELQPIDIGIIWFVWVSIFWKWMVSSCRRCTPCWINPLCATTYMAINEVNGKCRFSESVSSETLWRIFKKICTVDYSQSAQGGVSAHAWSCRLQASIFVYFLSLILFYMGWPIGPSNGLIHGSDNASWWHLHFLYGLDNKYSYFPHF